MPWPARISVLLCLAAAALCTGCGGASSPPPIGYWIRSSNCLAGIGRVALVDLSPEQGSAANARGMTEALGKGLQGACEFYGDRVPRADPALRDLTMNKHAEFTDDEVHNMREQLKCDAVLFGAVTQFSTHPRLEIGLSLRLVDLRENCTIWSVDHTWDTTDKQTEARMKEWFDKHMREEYEPAGWRMARMSPLTFQRFIAHEVVATLPAPGQ